MIIGVDLAEPQGPRVDFASLVREGVRFTIPKLGLGASYKSSTFDRDYDESRKAGIPVAAVYWWLTTADVHLQVKKTLDALGSRARDKGMRVAVDFEDQGFAALGPTRSIAACATYVNYIEDALGSECIIYTGAYFAPWAAGGDSELLAARRLWHASYPLYGRWKNGGRTRAEYEAFVAALPREPLHVAGPWARRGIKPTLHQADGDGGLYLPQGIDADFDVFLGDEQDFAAFLATGHEPVRPPAFVPTVTNIQRLLARLGLYKGTVDGLAGPQTRTAVTFFQSQHGLVVDGVVGPDTRAAFAAAWERLGADGVATQPGTPTAKRQSSQRMAAVDAPIVEVAPDTERMEKP